MIPQYLIKILPEATVCRREQMKFPVSNLHKFLKVFFTNVNWGRVSTRNKCVSRLGKLYQFYYYQMIKY